jgi:hypothetical protein
MSLLCPSIHLVRKYVDLNERERLSNVTLKPIKVKEHLLYCCPTFHSHDRVVNNDHRSYHNMSVNGPYHRVGWYYLYECERLLVYN